MSELRSDPCRGASGVDHHRYWSRSSSRLAALAVVVTTYALSVIASRRRAAHPRAGARGPALRPGRALSRAENCQIRAVRGGGYRSPMFPRGKAEPPRPRGSWALTGRRRLLGLEFAPSGPGRSRCLSAWVTLAGPRAEARKRAHRQPGLTTTSDHLGANVQCRGLHSTPGRSTPVRLRPSSGESSRRSRDVQQQPAGLHSAPIKHLSRKGAHTTRAASLAFLPADHLPGAPVHECTRPALPRGDNQHPEEVGC